MNKSWLGKAKIKPNDPIIAGSTGTLKLTYVVGRVGIDDGGSIRIVRRNVCDSERPQSNDPRRGGYTTVTTTGNVRLIVKYDEEGHIRPWRKALQINVRDGSLSEGDLIIVTFGDQSLGGSGIRMQTFREQEHIFKVFVDPFRTGKYEEIEDSPQIRIVGGPASKIQIASPSYVVAGNQISITVRVLDIWGNRSDNYEGKISFNASDPTASLPKENLFTKGDYGVKRFDNVVLNSLGLHSISIEDDDGLKATSNPIFVRREKPELKLFWGDMHGQTKQTVGTGTLNEYFSFMRDIAAMDFGSWQGNDFQITKELWRKVCETTKKFNEPGRFVTFLGYEWSGLTPSGGDYNIYYLSDYEDVHRSNHWLVEEKSDEATDRYPISELWKTFHGRKDVMAVGHVGGRYANLNYFNGDIVPLIEIHSNHGTFEWFLKEALKRNLKVGFMGNSDDHTCRPGLTFPSGSSFNTCGGYTAVYASDLTREALWDAFWNRRCYATTGERIILWIDVNGHMMGEEFETDAQLKISVKVISTAPLHEVEVKRGIKTIFRHPFAKPKKKEEKLIKIEWSGVRVKSRSKRVNWDGGLYLDEGRITSFSEFAFDHPQQGVKRISNQKIEWNSTTGGDPDGVILKIDAPDHAEVYFYSKPTTFSFKPKEITYEPLIINAGGVNQQVKVSEISGSELPRYLEFSYIDKEPKKDLNPYWVRVVQSDGGMAWSSPVYVKYKQ